MLVARQKLIKNRFLFYSLGTNSSTKYIATYQDLIKIPLIISSVVHENTIDDSIFTQTKLALQFYEPKSALIYAS